MSYLQVFDISQSALDYHRLRADLMAQNLAQARVLDASGSVPRARDAVAFSDTAFRSVWNSQRAGGIARIEVVEREAPAMLAHDPGHPQAGPEGFVASPSLDVAWMMTTFMDAARAYQTNVQAMNLSKQMLLDSLKLGG